MAPQLSLTTNGLLARRAPAELWPLLDRVTLSWYSSAPLPEETHRYIEDVCSDHDIVLTVKPSSSFQRITPDRPRGPVEVRPTYDACWMRHRCHLLHQGRFYKCTRPPHLADSSLPLTDGYEPTGDGVDLEPERLLERLVTYLEQPDPLDACTLCLGGDGPSEPHHQEPSPARL